MRNILACLLTVMLFVTNSYSQQEVEFKNKYISGKEYHQQTNTTSKSVLTYSGSKELLNYLKKQKIKNPQKTTEESILKIIYRIGSTENNISQLEIEYVETGNPDENSMIKKGDKILGTIDENNKLELTSISNDSIYGEDEAYLLTVFEYGFTTEIFDGKTMKIGDTLINRSLMKIPISDNELDLAIVNVYKLKKIKNGIAYFDITQTASINSNLTELSLTAKGNGKGKCEFNIKEQHILKSTNTLNLQMSVEIDDDIQVTVNLRSIVDSRTTIKN